MDEVIAKIEEATEPSRWLDSMIHLAVTGAATVRDGEPAMWTPHYTSSVEVALRLAPLGCDFLLARGRLTSEERQFGAVFYEAGSVECGVPPAEREIGIGEHNATLAMAVCIAGLRARQSR